MRSIRAGFGARSRGVSLEEENKLSPEAAAAIGAGDKSIPAPKKDGEVPANVSTDKDPVAGNMDGTKGPDEPKDKNDIGSSAVKKDGEVENQVSNGEDPTASIATGGEGKTKPLVGTAGALESKSVKAPKKAKYTAFQRARLKTALEEEGMTSEEAETEVRRSEGEPVEPVVPESEPGALSADGEAAAEITPTGDAARSGETPEVPEVPAVVEGAEGAEAAAATDVEAGVTPEVSGDPAELDAGAEAAVGGEPGDGGAAQLDGGAAEIPVGGEEAAAGLADTAGLDDLVDDGRAIDPGELDVARRTVEIADRRLAGRAPAAPMRGETGAAADAGLPTEVEAETEEADDNASSLETELMDVVDTEAGFEETDERIEEGERVVEALESYRAALRIATESGGLDRHGARVLQIGLETLYTSIDHKVERTMMSLESFGGTSKKVSATQHTMEDLGTQIGKIWAKIIAGLRRAVEWLKQVWAKLFSEAEKLKSRAQAMGQKAKSIEGQPAAREFEDETLAERLLLGAKAPAGAEGIGQVLKVGQSLFKTYGADLGIVENNLRLLQPVLQGQKPNLAEMKMTATQINTFAKKEGSEDGMDRWVSPTMPGNKVVVWLVPQSVEDVARAKAGIDEASSSTPTSNGKLQVLAVPAMGQISDIVAKVLEQVIAVKNDVAKAEQIAKQYIAFGEKMAGTEPGGEVDEETLMAVRSMVSGSRNIISQPYAAFNSYAIGACRAQLAYVEKSMAQYGAKQQEPAAAPAAA